MAIHDLLWACPVCLEGRLDAEDRCDRCGARFRRGRGDTIVASGERGTMAHPAAAWLDRLSEPERAAPATIRWRTLASTGDPVRFEGRLIGWVESYGPWRKGRLELRDHALHISGEGGRRSVPLEDLATMQAVSGGLVLRTREEEVLTIRFDAASVLRWERALGLAIRRRWTELGRGEILEFQPRILAE